MVRSTTISNPRITSAKRGEQSRKRGVSLVSHFTNESMKNVMPGRFNRTYPKSKPGVTEKTFECVQDIVLLQRS